MVQTLQFLRNVYILNMTCHHMPKYFLVSDENYPNKDILVPRHAKDHTSVFFIWQRLLIGSFDF